MVLIKRVENLKKDFAHNLSDSPSINLKIFLVAIVLHFGDRFIETRSQFQHKLANFVGDSSIFDHNSLYHAEF